MLFFKNFKEDCFSSFAKWEKLREKILIKNENQLEQYQKQALNQIYKYYKIKKSKPSRDIPELFRQENSKKLSTSGSQSSNSRFYHYSMPQYQVIENHHWWRIEKDHELTKPGLVFDLMYQPTYRLDEPYKECFIKNHPNNDPTGFHNEFKTINYRRNTSQDALINVLNEVKDLNPKVLVCSPSQLEWIYFLTKGKIKFNFPLVTTRETLYDHVREMGDKIFTKVINKMRCWDGGLTFHDCAYGTLHVCDELCYAEEIDGQICTTDFFNYSSPFIRYLNGDAGNLDKKECKCGIFGNYFKKFEGRTTSLIHVGEYAIPGSLIIEDINSLIKFGGCSSSIFSLSMLEKYNGNPFSGTDIIYCIRQKLDESIDFICQSDPLLSEMQKQALIDGLNFILYRKAGRNLKINEKEKKYSIEKKEIRIIQDKNLLDETSGLRNKRQSISTEIRK